MIGGQDGGRSLDVGGCRLKTYSLLSLWSKEIVEGTFL